MHPDGQHPEGTALRTHPEHITHVEGEGMHHPEGTHPEASTTIVSQEMVCGCYMKIPESTAQQYDCVAVEHQRFTLKSGHAFCKAKEHEHTKKTTHSR
jgi:hypothetical protein